MSKRFYTILILPDATSQAHKFHISKPVLTAISALVGLVLISVLFFIFQYVSMSSNMLELKRLRKEMAEKGPYVEKVKQLVMELSYLKEFDRRLRVLVGLDKGGPPSQLLGMGGAEGGSSAALREAWKLEKERLAERMSLDLMEMEKEISQQEASFRELQKFLENQRSLLASTPTIWPVKGLLTGSYGYRRSPFTGKREMHEGLDIATRTGAPVVATADGVVTFSSYLSGFGYTVVVSHGYGYSTFYGHNQANKVRVGQRVKRGDVIAYVGDSGRSTGPHLHYEIQVNGVPVDPMKYIVEALD